MRTTQWYHGASLIFYGPVRDDVQAVIKEPRGSMNAGSFGSTMVMSLEEPKHESAGEVGHNTNTGHRRDPRQNSYDLGHFLNLIAPMGQISNGTLLPASADRSGEACPVFEFLALDRPFTTHPTPQRLGPFCPPSFARASPHSWGLPRV